MAVIRLPVSSPRAAARPAGDARPASDPLAITWRECALALALLALCLVAAFHNGFRPDRRIADTSLDYGEAWILTPPADLDQDIQWGFDASPYLLDVPLHELLADRLVHGDLPLWNPYVGLGYPWLGNLRASFFSPFLPVLLVGAAAGNFYHWVDYYLLCRLLVAGFGMYLFCRLLGTSRAAAGLGAVALMITPNAVLRVQMWDTTGAVWYPAGLAAAEYLLRRPTARAAAILGLVLAAAFYSSVEPGLYCWLATAGYFALRWVAEAIRRHGERRWVAGAALAGGGAFVLALMLSAASLGPTLEYMSHGASTSRPFFTLAPAYWWPYLPGKFTEFVKALPTFAPFGLAFLLPAPSWPFIGPYQFTTLCLYPGLVAVPLALVGLVAPSRLGLRPAVMWPLRLFFFALCFNYLEGVLPLFVGVNTAYGVLLMALTFAAFAAIGLDTVSRLSPRAVMRVGGPLLIALALLSFAATIYIRVKHVPNTAETYERYSEAVLNLPVSLERVAVVLGFVVVLALAWRYTRLVRWAAVGAVAAELMLLTRLGAPPHIVFENTVPQALRDFAWQDGQPVRSLGIGHVMDPNTNMFARFPEFRMRDDIYPREYAAIWDHVSNWQRAPGHGPLRVNNILLNDAPPNWDLLRVYGIQYLATHSLLPGERDRLIGAQELLATAKAPEKAREQELADFALPWEQRTAVRVAPDTTLWEPFAVAKTERPWIRVGYALDPGAAAAPESAIRMDIVVRDGKREKLAATQVLVAHDYAGTWVDRTIDMTQYRGRQVHIGLRTRPVKGAPPADLGWSGIWVGTDTAPVGLEQAGWVLQRVPDALPRAYLAQSARPLGSFQAFLERPPADVVAGRTVLLEPAPASPPATPPDCTPGRVRYTATRMASAELTYASACPAYLVVTDLWYPGWRAWLEDGTELPVLKANGAVRAVAVPPGSTQSPSASCPPSPSPASRSRSRPAWPRSPSSSPPTGRSRRAAAGPVPAKLPSDGASEGG